MVVKEVVNKVVEAVECRYHGLVTIEMCMKCPYFGGYVGFKKIRCKRGMLIQEVKDENCRN